MSLAHLSGAVDFTALEAMTGAEDEITAEVLDLFVQQASLWSVMLDADHPGWRDALHTLRGAAGGIGALSLAQVCAQVEAGDDDLAVAGLNRVDTALKQVLSDIAVYRHELLRRSLAD